MRPYQNVGKNLADYADITHTYRSEHSTNSVDIKLDRLASKCLLKYLFCKEGTLNDDVSFTIDLTCYTVTVIVT